MEHLTEAEIKLRTKEVRLENAKLKLDQAKVKLQQDLVDLERFKAYKLPTREESVRIELMKLAEQRYAAIRHNNPRGEHPGSILRELVSNLSRKF